MRHIVRVNLLAVIVGTIVGLLGSAFFFCIGHGYALLLMITSPGAMGAVPGWAIGAVVGAALVGLSVFLTHRFAPETTGSGIQEIEGTLSGLRPPLRWHRIIPVKFICGVLAMAAGMILGREGPTIHMGGAVGAAVAALSKADDYNGKALVAAASGAGLAVAFNAPLGGILFVVEELRDKFSITPIVLNGVIVASMAASITGILILDPGRLLPITVFEEARWVDVALAMPLAAILGLYAALFNASIPWAQDALGVVAARIGRLPLALLIGGTIGALAGVLPEATGGGEASPRTSTER